METQDIVERLNQRQAEFAEMGSAPVIVIPADYEALEAADEITRLRAEVERLREALDTARLRLETLADRMMKGKADGGVLGGRQLSRALPGIFSGLDGRGDEMNPVKALEGGE